MSDVTEVRDVHQFNSENFKSSSPKSGMESLQMNLVFKELPSPLELPEERIEESRNDRNVVPLETFTLLSNTEVNKSSENVNFSPTYTMHTNYQKCEINNSFNLDINVQKIDNQSVNKDSLIVIQNKQTIEHCEVADFIIDPVAKASEEECEDYNICELQTSSKESNQPDENENLAAIQNSSACEILQEDKSQNPSSLILSTIKGIQNHNDIIQSHHISASVNVDAPMLTYILGKTSGSETELEDSLIFLDCMKRIEKWFAKLDELNHYNAVRFEALLKKMLDFKRLESLVKEKQAMLVLGKDLSFFDQDSNFEMSTYRSFYDHCEHILRLLKHYERYLKAAYERHSKLRAQYLDCSLQIVTYPIEEKLFENRKHTMNIINQSSKLMNNMSFKLEETDNFTDNLSFECISIVKNFLRDCEITFSQ